jgi:hypothetical protein
MSHVLALEKLALKNKNKKMEKNKFKKYKNEGTSKKTKI